MGTDEGGQKPHHIESEFAKKLATVVLVMTHKLWAMNICKNVYDILSAIKVWEDQTSLKFRETTEKHAQEG